jgi:hypothetical protein
MGLIPPGSQRSETLLVRVDGTIADQVDLTVADVRPDGVLDVTIDDPIPTHRGDTRLVPVHIKVPAGVRAVNLLGPEPERLGKIVLATGYENAPDLVIYVKLATGGR